MSLHRPQQQSLVLAQANGPKPYRKNDSQKSRRAIGHLLAEALPVSDHRAEQSKAITEAERVRERD